MPEPPDYIRIADLIEADVAAGRLESGAKLPKIREMAAQHDVGETTIKKVLIRLEARDVVLRKQGKGVYIR